MGLVLTPDQHALIEKSVNNLAKITKKGAPFVDPVTKKEYVLVSADVYQRVQALLGEEEDLVRDMSGRLVDLSPEDWEDAATYDSPKP